MPSAPAIWRSAGRYRKTSSISARVPQLGQWPVFTEGKGLIGALRYYGFPNIGQKQKDAMRDRIMRGWPFTPEEQKGDSRLLRRGHEALRLLLARMLPEI